MKKMQVGIKTIKDQVYNVLKTEILNGEFAPNERLNEQLLADRFNVSRSPVREAIKQLAGDGLVVNVPNKGAFIKTLNDKELGDVYDVRLMFELYAAERALENLRPVDVQALQNLRKGFVKSHKEANMRRYIELDMKLHTLLIRLGDNELITSTYDNIFTMVNNFRVAFLSNPERFAESLDEHLGIVDALLAGDGEKLVWLITRHLTLAKGSVQKTILHEDDA